MKDIEVIKINPYDDEHIKLVEGFEKELDNKLPISVSSILLKIRNKSQEDYLNDKRTSNRIEDNYYLMVNNRLVSSCYVEGDKDLKSCSMDLLTLPNERCKGYGSYLLENVSNRLFNEGILTQNLYSTPGDKACIKMADKAGFVLIGSSNGYDINLQKVSEDYLGKHL